MNANSIVAELAKTTENYAVYESAEVGGSQDLTGMYVSLSTFGGEPLDFIEVTVGDDEAVPVVKQKDTTNYGVYESESGAISGSYFAHDVLDSEETEDDGFSAPDENSVTLAPATESDFEDSQEDEELAEEADALLSGAGDDDAVEVEEEDTSEEDEAADLLEEAEEAA